MTLPDIPDQVLRLTTIARIALHHLSANEPPTRAATLNLPPRTRKRKSSPSPTTTRAKHLPLKAPRAQEDVSEARPASLDAAGATLHLKNQGLIKMNSRMNSRTSSITSDGDCHVGSLTRICLTTRCPNAGPATRVWITVSCDQR